jgi:predicted glycoside hydrolase/deacetylase ChbG (UPF0249 family)
VKAKGETRFLIINADDFGLTNGVNRGIIEAHERGVVTSASLMVRHPAAAPAAVYARTHPELSVGLHFDVQEWRYRDRQWEPAYQLIDTANARAVCQEFERQLAAFERLLARAPTHLDSHQHVHLTEPARSILLEYAEQLGAPLRSCAPSISYHGGFYGQTDEGASFPTGISAEAFLRVLQTLAPGWTEVGCHPGYADGLDSVYSVEREEEIRVLCSAEVRAALDRSDLQLRSFHDFGR